MSNPAAGATSVVRHAKRLARRGENLVQRALTTAGLRQSEKKIANDAQAYWRRPGGDRWRGNSHWRDASVFAGSDLWSAIGREHLELLERGARMAGFTRKWDRIVDWGCGGGANAVAFAPRAQEYFGVDISSESLRECEREVAGVCDTPFVSVPIDVNRPESALAHVTTPCDLFLSFYVFELIPSPEYGERLLRIAHHMLASGGLALIQIKYDTGSWWTRSRGRGYRSGLAEMTTYRIERFWELATENGLIPQAVYLVPQNQLDQHYAYFFLSKT
ncbi:class I SAM-dependent methyltransferase [Amycolatopsis sp. MEPSY49]|uniref:class I SAM-dependent methyltransferase n=1 Tax=Amycolatopsis sp. MEPSY49 TaxID=3151600 RepID=UPI003EF409D5